MVPVGLYSDRVLETRSRGHRIRRGGGRGGSGARARLAAVRLAAVRLSVNLGLAAAIGLAGCSSVGPRDTGPTTGDADADAAAERGTGTSVEVRGPVVTVKRIIDGDSLELLVDGEGVEVRLLGINAPELRTVGKVETCTGREARQALETLLADGTLSFYPGQNDRFGRVLAQMEVDGRSVAESMVSQGWALALWSGEDPRLTETMMAAASNRLGLWGDTCGRTKVELEISDHQVDAPGNDEANLDQEWVEITNLTTSPVDLDQWTIADETTSNRFMIGSVALGPSQSIRIHTGPGSASDRDLYLNQDYPVWSNRGETVLVVDPAGLVTAYLFIH